MRAKLFKDDLLFPDLSYQITGCAFEVYNELKSGKKEKVYQDAMEICFNERGIKYKKELNWNINFKGVKLTNRRFDFLVEDSVIVELKRNAYSKEDIDQVIEYLSASGYKLAILFSFGAKGVNYKRLVHPQILVSPENKNEVPSH